MPPPGRKGLPPSIIRGGNRTGFMYQQQSLGLAGPSRSTIEAAQADRAHILGVLKDIPVKEAKQREEDLTAAKDRASNLMQQKRLERGIEHHCGAYYITAKQGEKMLSAMRFTKEEAEEARKALIDFVDSKSDGDSDVQYSIHDEEAIEVEEGPPLPTQSYPLFIGSCGQPKDGRDNGVHLGRVGEQLELISSNFSWVDCQECCPDHLNSRGGFDRCEIYGSTTPTTVLERLMPALQDADRDAHALELPVAIYIQKKVHSWLFRKGGAGERDTLWEVLSKYPIVIGPHFSRINRSNCDSLWPTFEKLGFKKEEFIALAEHRSTLQKANQFGGSLQSSLSQESQGVAGFAQRPENIDTVRREKRRRPSAVGVESDFVAGETQQQGGVGASASSTS